jgi:hypothetical protein
MFVVAAVVDKERLERFEQQPGGIFYARSDVSLFAHDAS